MKVLGINGSLRADSLNLRLLRAAGDQFSDTVEFEILNLGDVPLYNQDLDGDNKPAGVVQLKTKIEAADALLLATPEYNYSMSGVIKNAIDWASRPAFASPLAHKPAAILTASMSPLGGARAQADMRNVLAGTLTPVLTAVEYLLGSAHTAFDEGGALVDEAALRRLKRYIGEFESWVARR